MLAHLINRRIDPIPKNTLRDCEDAQTRFQWIADNARTLLEEPTLATGADEEGMDTAIVGLDKFKEELDLCVEMAKLLPVKATRIRE